MAYLTFEEYKEMGGTAEETAFNALLVKASVRIDYVTNHRINEDNKPDNLAYLCKEIIDIFANWGINRDPALTSYTNGIESFGYSAGSAKESDTALNNLIIEYLSNRPDLIYRGC